LVPQQPNDQVQPLDLASCVLVVEISFRSVGHQASMVVSFQQLSRRYAALISSMSASLTTGASSPRLPFP
jgi:hypothetical protein